MSHLRTELSIRALRAQLGTQFRRHGPVIDTLRLSVMELEQQTEDRDVDYLHDRLAGVLHKWRINLLIQANPWLILQRAFYSRPSQLVGPGLLGNIIVTDDGRAARIAEVVTSEDAPRDARSLLPSQAVGRLMVSEESREPKVCVLCGRPPHTSTVALASIEPLEGLALMTAQAPSDQLDIFSGASIVHALGLGNRPHVIDLTHRRSAVQIASILQPVPLAIGRPKRVRRGSRTREWRWSIASP